MGARSAGLFADLGVALALFAASLLLYGWSPGTPQMCDSVYSLATAQCLLQDRSLELGAHLSRTRDGLSRFPGFQEHLGHPYHLRRLPDGLYYAYPLGSTMLSLPLVALMRARGVSAFDAHGTFDLEGETRMQCEAAWVVTAATVAGFYFIARTYLARGPAAGVAALFATGSMAWSTLSRALWSHTWAVAILTLAVLLIARVEAGQVDLARPGVAVLFGTLSFWGWFTRPQLVVQLAPAFVILCLRRPRACGLAALTYLGWRLALAGCCLAVLGQPTPPTSYDNVWYLWISEDPPAVLAGYLISPSRGLLIFCPWIAVVAWVLVRHRATLPAPALALAAGAALAGTVAMLVAFKALLGGHSYGPRYFSDALPWFVLASAQAFAARPARGARIALALTFAWAIWVHGRGATEPQTWAWNEGGVSYEQYAARAFDWRHPQWAAGLTFRVLADGRREP